MRAVAIAIASQWVGADQRAYAPLIKQRSVTLAEPRYARSSVVAVNCAFERRLGLHGILSLRDLRRRNGGT